MALRAVPRTPLSARGHGSNLARFPAAGGSRTFLRDVAFFSDPTRKSLGCHSCRLAREPCVLWPLTEVKDYQAVKVSATTLLKPSWKYWEQSLGCAQDRAGSVDRLGGSLFCLPLASSQPGTALSLGKEISSSLALPLMHPHSEDQTSETQRGRNLHFRA